MKTNTPTPLGFVGARIRSLREKRGLTQAALAESIPMDRSNLSRLESGGGRHEDIGLCTIVAIAKALGVPPADLLPKRAA